MPIPLHGKSAKIKSASLNLSSKILASATVGIIFENPCTFAFSLINSTLFSLTSQEYIFELLSSLSARRNDFPPGAAHTSTHFLISLTPSTFDIIDDDVSVI